VMVLVVITSVIVQCIRQVRGHVAVDRQGVQIIRMSSERLCQQAQRRESIRVHFCCCRRWLNAIAADLLTVSDRSR
jgi:hypothetical protein